MVVEDSVGLRVDVEDSGRRRFEQINSRAHPKCQGHLMQEPQKNLPIPAEA